VSPSRDGDSGNYFDRPSSGRQNVYKGGLAMKFIAALLRKLSADRDLWVKTKKVLKVALEVLGFIAAIKTIFS